MAEQDLSPDMLSMIDQEWAAHGNRLMGHIGTKEALYRRGLAEFMTKGGGGDNGKPAYTLSAEGRKLHYERKAQKA